MAQRSDDDYGDYDLAPEAEAPKPKRPAPPRVPPGVAAQQAAGKAAVKGTPAKRPGKAPTAMQAAATMPGRTGGRSPVKQDVHAAAQKRQILLLGSIFGVLALLIVGVVIGFEYLGGNSSGPSVGEDAAIRKEMSGATYEEAREWAAQGNGRTLNGHSPKQTLSRIEQIYDLGAKQVKASGGRMSLDLVVELPPGDAAARQRLIDYANTWYEKYEPGHPPQTDVGQTYLMLKMPLVL